MANGLFKITHPATGSKAGKWLASSQEPDEPAFQVELDEKKDAELLELLRAKEADIVAAAGGDSMVAATRKLNEAKRARREEHAAKARAKVETARKQRREEQAKAQADRKARAKSASDKKAEAVEAAKKKAKKKK